MDIIDQRQAEVTATEVIRSHNITMLPVCPFAIADRVGILVAPKPSREPGVSGFLMRVGDTFGIQYAQHIVNPGFIRFTVAHELGHYFLPGHAEYLFATTVVHASRSGYVSQDRYERQADHFASALLMPENLFRQAVDDAGSGFAAVQSLATTCNTSLTATAIRYAHYTDEAVAVVVSTGDKIDYCFLSERLKDVPGVVWPRKGSLLPPRSETREFNRVLSNITGAVTAEGASMLDEWFDGGPSVELNEDVVGLGSYGKTLTVLFTDEPLEAEDEDEED